MASVAGVVPPKRVGPPRVSGGRASGRTKALGVLWRMWTGAGGPLLAVALVMATGSPWGLVAILPWMLVVRVMKGRG